MVSHGNLVLYVTSVCVLFRCACRLNTKDDIIRMCGGKGFGGEQIGEMDLNPANPKQTLH